MNSRILSSDDHNILIDAVQEFNQKQSNSVQSLSKILNVQRITLQRSCKHVGSES